MEASLLSMLRRGRMKKIFEIDRAIKDVPTLRGFIVDFSEELLLLHQLDVDTFSLNGYTAVQIRDVKRYGEATRGNWYYKAASHFGVTPAHPERIELDSLSALVRSVAQRHPLITLHPERKNPDICYVGHLSSIELKRFSIHDLNSNCLWAGQRSLKFADISRIDFADRYSQGLWVAARNKPKSSLAAKHPVFNASH